MNSNELFKYDLLVFGPTLFFKITLITNCMHKKTTANIYGFVYSFNNNFAFHRVCIFNNLTMYGKYVLQQLLSFIHNLRERICGQHTYTIRLLPQLKVVFYKSFKVATKVPICRVNTNQRLSSHKDNNTFCLLFDSNQDENIKRNMYDNNTIFTWHKTSKLTFNLHSRFLLHKTSKLTFILNTKYFFV